MIMGKDIHGPSAPPNVELGGGVGRVNKTHQLDSCWLPAGTRPRALQTEHMARSRQAHPARRGKTAAKAIL